MRSLLAFWLGGTLFGWCACAMYRWYRCKHAALLLDVRALLRSWVIEGSGQCMGCFPKDCICGTLALLERIEKEVA